MADQIEALRRKYSGLAEPDQPAGVTGAGVEEDQVDALRRKYATGPSENEPDALSLIPGRETRRGTYVPDLGAVYQNQEADSIPELERRRNVRAALAESIRDEELLRKYGVEVPQLGQEPQGALKYLQMPLALLKQLQRPQFATVGALQGILEGDPGQAVKNFYRGLVLAEEHSTHDLLKRYEFLQESPFANFAVTLTGDIALDPLTYLSFGTSALSKARVLGKGLKAGEEGLFTAEHLAPLLSDFGNKVLKESVETAGEDAAVKAIMQEVGRGTKLGKKLIPSGVRFAHWVPKVGNFSVGDMLGRLVPLSPYGVIQKTEDLIASQEVTDKLVDTMLNSGVVDWFGKAFMPYWNIRRKYPLIVDLDRALQSKNYDDVARILERGKELVKSLPDEADRKLLTELMDHPELISGKKLATIHVVDPEVPEMRINTDYFPELAKFDESNAQELVDFFIDTRNRLKAGGPDVIAQATKVGGGAFGAVYGGAKFEPLRPLFEEIQAAFPEAKAYKVQFKDWVMKFPIPGGFKHAVDIGEEYTAGHMVHADAIKDAAAELYSAQRLAGSDVIPEMGVVWRRADEIDPSMSEQGLALSFDTLNVDRNSRPLAWAQVVGGWAEYLRKVPEDARQFQNINEFAKYMNTQSFKPGEMHLPIIVKKFVKGENLEDWGLIFRQGIRHQPKDYNGTSLAKVIEELVNVNKNAAKAGIGIRDAHNLNFMVSDSNKIVWVDNARFVDHSRGFGSSGPEHELFDFGAGYTTVEEQQLARESLPHKLKVFREEAEQAHPVKPAPIPHAVGGVPVVEKLYPKFEAASNSQAVGELEVAFRKAFHTSMSSMLNSDQSAVRYLVDSVASKLPETEKAKLGEYLKKAGIVNDYTMRRGKLSLVFKTGDEVAFEPLSKVLTPFKPRREWDEQIEVLVSKHPELVNASAERQDQILKTYHMAKVWRDQIKDTLIAHGLEETGKVKPLTESDIAVNLTKHAIDVSAATNARQYVEDVAKIYGKPAKVVNVTNKAGKTTAKLVADPGYKIIDHPALEGIQIPIEAANTISKYTRTFGDIDQAGRTFWRNFDKVQGIWKGYATFVNPGFHGRNFASNLWLLHLKNGPEAFDPRVHQIAVDVMRGKEGALTVWGNHTVPYSEIMDTARRYGVYGTGWVGADVKGIEDIKSILSGAHAVPSGYNLLSQNNLLFQAGRAAGGAIENEARMVGFILDWKASGNPAWAAQNTKKFMFDYNELTQFDKNVMKRIFPFWAFFKKNAALQAEQILKQPGKYADIAKVKSALEANSPKADERWLPKYFPELYAMRTPFTSKKGSPLYFNPNFPFQDINKYFSPADWLSSMGPWKTLFEVGLNKQFFNQQDIQHYKGEVVPVPWLSIMPEDLMTKIGPKIGAVKAYDPESKQWFWGLNPKVKYVIEQANPFFKSFGKVAQTATGGYTPEGQEEKQPYDVMSWMTGAKFMPYNPTENFERSVFEHRNKLRDMKKSAIAEGKIPSRYLPPTH